MLPEGQPLAAPVADESSEPYSPLAAPVADPSTTTLLSRLDGLGEDLAAVCRELHFDLPSDFEEPAWPGELDSTPFATPLQQFTTTAPLAVGQAYTSFPLKVQQVPSLDPAPAAELCELDCDAGSFQDDTMSAVQLAVIGSTNSNRWDGSQGASYWRKKPAILEALAAHCRARGGYMQVADQWGVLSNLIEPLSGAAAWLEKLHGALAHEIAEAHKGVFPSATLTDPYAKAALGHLATHEEYCQALRLRLEQALPAVDIAMASDYTPSRASGALIPVPRQVASPPLSATDEAVKRRMETNLTKFLQENEETDIKHTAAVQDLKAAEAARDQLVKQLGELRQTMAAEQSNIPPDGGQSGPSAPNEPQQQRQPQDAAAEAATKLTEDHKAQEQQLLANIETANEACADAEEVVQELSKILNRSLTAILNLHQQLDKMGAVKTPAAPAEVVKAFAHPVSGKLCTPHDCVMLKVIATMDVVYGIAAPLQQVNFSELRQGQGSGVSPDESVREFAARIQLHANSQLKLDPKLAHVQFLAGLTNRELADEAHRVLLADGGTALNLETAAEKVMLLEHRHLEHLKLRAQNGDVQAAAELKRRAAFKPKKAGKPDPKPDPKPDDKPKREFHPDPNHPDGRCRLPGHTKGAGHSNKECRLGGNASAATFAATATPALQPHAAPYLASQQQQYTMPAQQQPAMHAAAAFGYPYGSTAVQPQQPTLDLQQMALYFANAVALNNKPGVPHKDPTFRPQGPGLKPGPVLPSAHGNKCNICGYPPGHSTGFCYYDQPDKNPSWRPSANAPPHMIAMWKSRRQQLGLPPAEPRVPGPRQQPTAAMALPYHAPMPMLPAPPSADASGGAAAPNSTGNVIALPAIAQMGLPDQDAYVMLSEPFCFDEFVASAMPRSFLQYPSASSDIFATQVPAAAPAADAARSSLVRRLRFVDEQEQRAAVQAPTPAEREAMLAELSVSNQVLCLDTFLNRNAATGVSFELPDGRLQLPRMVIVDSGATYGVGFESSCRAIGLHWRANGYVLSLTLADGTKVKILGVTDPVRLWFAKGTPQQRCIEYRFLVLPGEGKYYQWIVAKNALKSLGAYVDPEESAFVYRLQPGKDSPKHALPVQCTLPADDAAGHDALYMLQPVVAVAICREEPAADAAGH